MRLLSCSHATLVFFFFNDTATTEIYTLSLHDALPICEVVVAGLRRIAMRPQQRREGKTLRGLRRGEILARHRGDDHRSEEHTSELQSRQYLVCRLLLEKKKIHVQRESWKFYVSSESQQ